MESTALCACAGLTQAIAFARTALSSNELITNPESPGSVRAVCASPRRACRAPATVDWLVAVNPEPGRVRLSMAGLQSIAPPAGGMPVLWFRFHIVGSAGDTVLDLSRQQAFDLARQAVPSAAVDGRLIVSAVPVPVWSLGRLRAAFAPTAAAAR